MHPDNSEMNNLHRALVKAEDNLFGVIQGYVPNATDSDKAIAGMLREEIYTLMGKVHHYYYPNEEPTWDYDQNNTYCETVSEASFSHRLSHSDGTTIAVFKLREVTYERFVVVDIHPRMPMPNYDPVMVERLVAIHIKNVEVTVPAE